MKVLFLANKSSTHASRWANELNKRGYNICYCSVIGGDQHLDEGIEYNKLKFDAPWGYFLNVLELKKIVSEFNPDLIHVHYASGNGLLASLVGFKPLLLSVYGSDVYRFPHRSNIHRLIFKYIISKSTWVCSTGHNMAEEIFKVYGTKIKNLSITPFGVDLRRFSPVSNIKADEEVVVGTIKKVEDIYGIDTLVKAFAKVVKTRIKDVPNLRLLIVGSGSKLAEIKELVKDEGVEAYTTFTGRVPHSEIQKYFNKIDIFVALSRSESFGVSVIEAGACEKPVVVSNVGGLPEVVDDGETGIIVDKDSIEMATEAILKLILDRNRRLKLGKNARKKVKNIYDWKKNVDKMEKVYASLV